MEIENDPRANLEYDGWVADFEAAARRPLGERLNATFDRTCVRAVARCWPGDSWGCHG